MVIIAPATDHPEERLGDDDRGDAARRSRRTRGGARRPRRPLRRSVRTTPTSSGARAYGLVNELERAGFDAGMNEPWHVPVTRAPGDPGRRGAPPSSIWATGGFVDAVARRRPRRRGRLVRPADAGRAAASTTTCATALIADLEATRARRSRAGSSTPTCSRCTSIRGCRRSPGADRAHAVPRPGDGGLHRATRGGDDDRRDRHARPRCRVDRRPGAPWSWQIVAAAISLVILLSTVARHPSWLRVDRRQRAAGAARRSTCSGRNHPWLGTWTSASLSSGVDMNNPDRCCST